MKLVLVSVVLELIICARVSLNGYIRRALANLEMYSMAVFMLKTLKSSKTTLTSEDDINV